MRVSSSPSNRRKLAIVDFAKELNWMLATTLIVVLAMLTGGAHIGALCWR